jgi:hypothetical protein
MWGIPLTDSFLGCREQFPEMMPLPSQRFESRGDRNKALQEMRALSNLFTPKGVFKAA